MNDIIYKIAGIGEGIEVSGVTDPAKGLPIRVSIGPRKLYREAFGEKSISNKELNQIIAGDFAKDAAGWKHHFRSKNDPDAWIEIRKSSLGYINYYYSVIRNGNIDLIFVRPEVKHNPDKPRTELPIGK